MHALRLLSSANNEETWLRRQRNLNLRRNQRINRLPEVFFKERFRLDKSTFNQLCQDLRCLTRLRSSREIPLEVKVLCALSFFATGSYQRIIGVTHHLSQRTASRCIQQVVNAINHDRMMAKWINFPQTQQERVHIKQEFQRKFGLPGVIGCIDCTHVALVKPNNEEHLYFNRKGYHSINVQMICDSDLRILNVNSKFGGATHDAFIWSSSRAEAFMRELHQNGEQVWLLGDSGYPQRPWLMTPILNAAQGSREELYTRKHVQARNCIERCFGLLKARWRCLLKERALHYHPHLASKIILACALLHNMALSAQLPSPQIPPVVDDDEDDDEPNLEMSNNELIQGRVMLNCLINRL